jgi:hypothetical protein
LVSMQHKVRGPHSARALPKDILLVRNVEKGIDR